ncbi:MAG: hypothetical protein WBA74_09070 [Cyclobacteriaceae bacterium]
MKDWKKDILNSTKGMEKAHPPSDAFDHVLHKINNQDRVTESSRGWMAVAATVSLIVLCNAYFIVSYSSDTDSTRRNNTGSYTSLVSNYNLYDHDK